MFSKLPIMCEQVWQQKLRGRAREPMVLHIVGLIDDYLAAYPLLTFVRGEAFTPDHWASLFRLLKLNPPGAQTKV